MARQSYAAFQHRDFSLYQVARLLANTGFAMQSTAVGYLVYSITGRQIDLGYVGLALFLPAISFSLVTGHVADRFDRRRIVMTCQGVLALCSLMLYYIARQPVPTVGPIYAVLVLVGTAHAFYGPAGQALMPQLVSREDFPNAVAWNSSTWQITAIIGPAIGGAIYDHYDAATVFACDMLGTASGFVLMAFLRVKPVKLETATTSWKTLLAGLQYVWDRKPILGAISLDLFAVLFGGAVALLPVYASDILKVGESGFGLMRSAPAVGAMLTAVAVAHLPPMKRAGATMLWCVGIFGIATIGFGVSKHYYLSLACLVIMGIADMVSVVVRHTLVQVLTPHSMRGRVSAVNMVFIGASNELGQFESGLTAEWFGTVPAVVLGGVCTVLVVVIWAWKFPQLRKIRRLDTDEHAEEVVQDV